MEKHETSTGQKILDYVTNALKTGEIRPGDRIIPKNIAEQIGTSPIPVREALYQLVGREMVIERHREGFYVAPLNVVILQSLYREHAKIIDNCVGFWRPGVQRIGLLRDSWDLFSVIAAQSQCPALIGIQRYLAGRLMAARAHEMDRAKARECAAALTVALRDGDLTAIRNESERFHWGCCEQSSGIMHKISLLR